MANPNRTRGHRFQVWLSDLEWEKFQMLQGESGQTGADLIRAWITGQRIRSVADKKIASQLRQLGGLFKSALFVCHGREASESLVTQAMVMRGIADRIDGGGKSR